LRDDGVRMERWVRDGVMTECGLRVERVMDKR
jgi:hypothetical protein